MRLPNGYGSVYKLSGNRRRPWIACVTTGWTPEGKQIYYTIGYYKIRAEALDALADYNKNPIGERRDTTLQELYEAWSASKYTKISNATVGSYKAAWTRLSALGEYEVRKLRKSHIQTIVDAMSKEGISRSSCAKVKVLSSLLFKEALANSLTDQNYGELVELPEDTSNKRDAFTDDEIATFAKLAATDKWANTVMILIYSGLRIGELLGMKKANVDIEQMLFKGGIKTDAGKNKVVPIHSKIQSYVLYWYNLPGEYLITKDGCRVRTNYYRDWIFYPMIEGTNIRPHLTPHCARHTFGTLLDRAGANTKAIQELIGHADYNTTANIYTHPEIEALRNAIEQI